MAGTSGNNNWERIQQGVNDTERLIGQREYNSAMVKARQTLEYMVKQQAQRAYIAETSDLKELIDALYDNRWISKTTCEHYHKIRMIGNKAVHEDYSNAYDANQAYHMLSQEVYTFANDYKNAQKGTRGTARRTAPASSSAVSGGSSVAPARSRSAAGRTAGSSAARSRRRSARQRRGVDLYMLLKLLIPILSVILLICVIRLLVPEVKNKETTPETTVAAETTAAPESAAPETMAAALYRTTTVLNVRSQPNTDGTPLGKLAEGTTVDYVDAYNEEWAIIRYNGEEAYVASRYLTTE